MSIDLEHERRVLLELLDPFPNIGPPERDVAAVSSLIQASLHGASRQTAFSSYLGLTDEDHAVIEAIIEEDMARRQREGA